MIICDTLRAGVRASALHAVVGLSALGIVIATLGVASVPSSLMNAAAGLVEEGRVPSLSADPDSDTREDKAEAALGMDEETYRLVMKDTARDASFRYVIGTGGVLLAILMCVLVNDTRSPQIQVLVARPIHRSAVVVGQLGGGLTIVFLGVAVMSLCHYGMTAAISRVSAPECFVAALAILPNLLLMGALAYALATVLHSVVAASIALFASTALSALSALGRSLVGSGFEGALAKAVNAAYTVLPRVGDIQRAGEAVLFGDPLPVGYWAAVAVNMVYVGLLTGIACRVFARREV